MTASAALLGRRLGPAPRLRQLVVDQGFKAAFRAWWQTERGIQVETVKRTSPGFRLLPIRWIVERTFGWLSFYRRLQAHYE